MQKNSLNRRDRTLKIEAWNDSFANRLIIKEFCYYSVSDFFSLRIIDLVIAFILDFFPLL